MMTTSIGKLKRPSPSRRILMLITTLTFGGAETQVVRLAIELKSRGWDVAIACLVRPTSWVEQLKQEGIEVSSLEMARGVPDPRAIFRLQALIARFQPDIVHSHMVHANLLGRLARPFCRIPVLIGTVHNLRERSESNGPTWHKELMYRLTDFLSDRTTIISEAAFKRHVEVGAVPRLKLEVIPNGVDTLHFAPSLRARAAARESLGIDSATFVWLAV